MSRDEVQFMEIVSQSANLVGGHYCINLPLRNRAIKMPNNRRVAEQRALNLKRQFVKNSQFQADYTSFLNYVIAQGYALEIPSGELSRDDGKIWYLPHHGVYHPKKLKIRVVFDCGASYQGTTLNGQLLRGPDITSTLLGVIIRFRQEEVAVMADVEAMFHQVKVADEDADLLRFLWWQAGDISQDLKEYRMTVHLFGATSSPSCANFALRKCAEDNRDRFGALGINTVLQNFYVDDCLKSVSSEDEAVCLYHDLKGILEKGGFQLKKWWYNWMKDLHLLEDFEVARCFKPIGFGEATFSQLHHFADASETGYGTVSYLLQNNKNNRVHCTLELAKARVAPLKPITVPRMELAAATMAARMEKTLRSELQLQLKESVFWSDSTTVLKYIGNRTSRFRTFVANRVETILKLSEVRQWRYINTSKNLADHVSRGLKVHAFMQNETWIQGPDFLTKPEDEWPQNPDHSENLTTEDPEVRDVIVSATAAEEQVDTVQQFLENYSSWFRLRKAVAWILKVKNILIHLCQKRKELEASLPQSEICRMIQSLKNESRGSNLTVEDLKVAELEIIRFSQQQKFSEEISALRKGDRLKKGSHIYKLNPILQDGILRVGGRLHKSTMPEEVKHPAILHKNSHVTDLILREIHQSLAERELKRAIEEWNISRIEDTTRQKGIQWMFSPPAGSHHGGAWERLIRSVRTILNATLKLQMLDDEGFHTVLCEAEAIINSHPITKASSDPNDLEALTPNHLLLLHAKPSLPPGLFVKEDLYIHRRWKQVQYMADIFWKRWTREYLPQLQERQKWTRISRNFTVGDIVLIVDHTAPRNSWVMDKVVEEIPDKNGLSEGVTAEMDSQVALEALEALLEVTVIAGAISGRHPGKRAFLAENKLTIANVTSTAVDLQFQSQALSNDAGLFFSFDTAVKSITVEASTTIRALRKELFVNMSEFFDPKFDCDFRHGSDSSECSRGGEPYARPWGWYRFGLNVLDKYPDGNAWLGPDGWRDESVPGEWPVSFHGTGVDGAKAIARSCFRAGPRDLYGPGIYSTPDIRIASAFTKQFESNNGKKYEVIMQNRINPKKRKIIEEEKDYWLIPVPEGTPLEEVKKITKEFIRPYGILIKEVKEPFCALW
ncbi:hypothetical protein SRHO_G00334990 [Serrasalmus rhombeus]